MQKYNSFSQYLSIQYADMLEGGLKKFLLAECCKGGSGINDCDYFDDVEITSWGIIGVKFTKSQLEYVEFEVYLRADYLLVKKTEADICYTNGDHHLFTAYMKGSFQTGFKLGGGKITKINKRPFTEKLTKALVHVIDKEQMELYATIFLKYYCPEALKKPMSLDLTKILNAKGVTWHSAPLTSGVYGKTYFADDYAKIYDENQQPQIVKVKRGTILINTIKASERGDGALRNTIVHEAVHWYFHNNYFSLKYLLNNEATCAVCYKSDSQIDDEDIKWMESQARSLAPKILLPKKMFIKKFKEEYKKHKRIARSLRKICGMQRDADILSDTICSLAKFFDVSRASVKYRLIELGYTEADGVLNWNSETKRYFPTYDFNKEKLKDHQTFHISRESYLNLIEHDNSIVQVIRSGKLIYTDGLLVVNHPKYYENEKLTAYARDHVDECCVIVNVKSDSKPFKDSIALFSLCSGGSQRVEAQINDEQLAYLLRQSDENVEHFEKHKHELPSDFGLLVEHHIKKKGVSYEWVVDWCDLTAVTLRKLRESKIDDVKPITIIKFAIGMKLSYPYARHLITQAGINIERVSKQNSVLITLLTTFQRVGLIKTYKILKINNQEDYLKLSNRFIKAHILKKT